MTTYLCKNREYISDSSIADPEFTAIQNIIFAISRLNSARSNGLLK